MKKGWAAWPSIFKVCPSLAERITGDLARDVLGCAVASELSFFSVSVLDPSSLSLPNCHLFGLLLSLALWLWMEFVPPSPCEISQPRCGTRECRNVLRRGFAAVCHGCVFREAGDCSTFQLFFRCSVWNHSSEVVDWVLRINFFPYSLPSFLVISLGHRSLEDTLGCVVCGNVSGSQRTHSSFMC